MRLIMTYEEVPAGTVMLAAIGIIVEVETKVAYRWNGKVWEEPTKSVYSVSDAQHAGLTVRR